MAPTSRVQALPRGRWLDAWALLLLLVVALGVRLAFADRAPPFVTNDSLSYLLPGWDLVHGLGFAPILKRPPLYSAFIAGTIATFGDELRTLMLVQHLLGAVGVLATFGIGRVIFGTSAGFVAGALTAVSGPLIITEHYLMSEALFSVLQLGALLAYLLGVRASRDRWFVAAGLLLGLAALTRPIAQVTLLLLLAGLLLLLPRWRPVVRAGALVAGLFALTVLPWMVRNQLVQGTFAIAGGSGEGLAVRTIRYEQTFDFREPAGGAPDRQMARARRIFREEAEEGSAFELAGRLRDELNVSEIQAERIMRSIALDAILRQPGYYLQGTADMFAKTFIGRPVRLRQDWLPWRNIRWDERVEHLVPAPTPTEDGAFPTAEALASIYDPARWWALLAVLGFAGMAAAIAQQYRPALILGAVVLAQLLACAALIGIEYRYRYPLDPLVHVLAAGGTVALVTIVRRRRHTPSPPLPDAGAGAVGTAPRAARGEGRAARRRAG